MGFAARLRTILPLPWGEGWGEGIHRVAVSPVPWNRYRIETAEAEIRLDLWGNARWQALHCIGNRFDMRRRRAAAAADDVQPSVLRPVLQLRRQSFRCFRKAGRQERIG